MIHTIRWPAALALAIPVALTVTFLRDDPGRVAAGDVTQMEVMKAYLIDATERAKAMDMEFAQSIPDSALRWAPTDEVRDFAQQVEHTANILFIGQSMFGEAPPSFGDTDALLNDKATMAAAVGEAYDWILERLQDMAPEALAEEANFFGGRSMPRWRIGLFALEHAWWTRGQMVPYFRAHGVAPPSPRLF